MDAARAAQVAYRIRVEGRLDAGWAAWFDGLSVVADADGTTINGPVVDQAQLHGLLAKIRDLGLTLVSVERLRDGLGACRSDR